jgi:fucose 4-O-acetylase-like acetyltransferase
MQDPNRMNSADAAASGGSTGGRDYLHDVTIAKGLAIFLVVFGHIVTGPPPQGNEWYNVIRTALYAFHMPFFIYLSGYIFFYTDSPGRARANFGAFVVRRAERLLVPFLLFGLLIIAGKHAARHFIHVDNVAENAVTDIFNLFWFTENSAAKSVWYVFVLFEITIFAILALRIVRSPLFWMLLALPLSWILIIWMYIPGAPHLMTPVLYLDRFVLYVGYFFAGGVAIAHREKWVAMIDRHLWWFWALFIVTLVSTRIAGIFMLSLIACGLTSMPALHGLCRRVWMQRSRLLEILGKYSFSIYLLNTIGIGLAKGILFQFMSWNGPRFLVFLPVLLAGGLIGPVLVKTQIFRRVRYLDKITD